MQLFPASLISEWQLSHQARRTESHDTPGERLPNMATTSNSATNYRPNVLYMNLCEETSPDPSYDRNQWDTPCLGHRIVETHVEVES